MTDMAALGESIKTALGGAVTGVTVARGELTLDVVAPDILKVMVHLQAMKGTSRSWWICAV